MRGRRPSARTFLLLGFIILLIPYCIWAILDYRVRMRAVYIHAQEVMEIEARRISTYTQGWFSRTILLLEGISAAGDGGGTLCPPWLDDFIAASPDYFAYHVVEPSGVIACRKAKFTSSALPPPADFRQLPIFKTLLQTGQPHVSNVQYIPQRGTYSVIVSIPVRKADGTIASHLLLTIQSDALAALMTPSPTSRHLVTVIDGGGAIAASASEEFGPSGSRVTFVLDEKQDTASIRTASRAGDALTSVLLRIGNTDWRAIVSIPTAELDASARAAGRHALLVHAAVIATFILLALFLASRVLAPLKALAGFDPLVAGENSVRLPSAPSELAVAADHLRELGHQIRDFEDQLRALLTVLPFPAMAHRDDGAIALLNPAFSDAFGYTLSDIPNLMEWSNRAYPDPDYRAKVFEEVRTLRAAAESQPSTPVHMSLRICDKAGRERAALAYAGPVTSVLRFGPSAVRIAIFVDVTELYQARDMQRLHTRVWEQSSDHLLIVGLGGRIVDANPKTLRTTGYTLEELRALRGYDLFASQPTDNDVKLIRDRADTQGIATIVQTIRRKDGTLFDISASLAPIRNGRGEITTRLVVARELDDQLSREILLQRFTDLISSIGEGILSVDRMGRILLANPAACRIFEYSESELKALGVGALLPSRAADKHPDLVTSFFGSGGAARGMGNQRAVEARSKSGKLLRVEISLSKTLGPGGEVATAVVRDVTALYAAEQKAARTSQQLDIALEAIKGGVWSYEMRTRKFTASDQWYKMTGFRKGAIGDHLDDFKQLIHPDDRAGIAKHYERYRDGFEKEFVSEHRIRFANGEYRWIMDQGAFAEFDSAGAPLRMVGVHLDVTSSHEMRERLRQNDKMSAIGQLTGGVAHDLNNVLAVIMGNAELLEMAFADGSTNALRAKRIVDSTRNGAELISRLLAFSRQLPISPAEVDISEVVVDTIEALRRTLPGNIVVRYEPPTAHFAASLDQSMLQTSILNLCINARDAMPDGGQLTIALSADRTPLGGPEPIDVVVLSVTDTGCGMPPDVRARVFEPFFTTKPMGRGTGLGLSMVYGFVKQSHGDIEVRSEIGKGTTFILRFPRIGTIPAAATPDGQSSEAAVLDRTILLVDDDDAVRTTVREQLQAAGCRVREASSVDAAKALISGGPPGEIDFILCDLDLGPGSRGIELADWIHTEALAIPGAILSGYIGDAAEAIAAAGWSALAKPIRLGDIKRVIAATPRTPRSS